MDTHCTGGGGALYCIDGYGGMHPLHPTKFLHFHTVFGQNGQKAGWRPQRLAPTSGGANLLFYHFDQMLLSWVFVSLSMCHTLLRELFPQHTKLTLLYQESWKEYDNNIEKIIYKQRFMTFLFQIKSCLKLHKSNFVRQ